MIRFLTKIVFLTIFLIVNNSTTFGCEAEKYSNLFRGGRYQVDYEIEYRVNECGYDEKYEADCKIAYDSDKGLDYLEKNAYYPNSEHQYRVLRYAEVKDTVYYSDKTNKNKSIDIKKEHLTKRVWGHTATEALIIHRRDQKIIAEDEFFSMLGKITEDIKKLPNYKVRFIKCDSEFIDGVNYKVDEFKVLKPYEAYLKLYYFKGDLVKCIKILDATKLSNQTFPAVKGTHSGFVIVNIKQVGEVIDADILGVGSK